MDPGELPARRVGVSSSSAPDDASKDELCEAFSGLFEGILADVGSGDVSESDSVAAIKGWAGDMREVGTPGEMPDEARQGFEVLVEAAEDLDDNASLGDLESLGGDLSAPDQEAGDAFGAWAIESRPSALPGLDDLPTDLPAELPSELESLRSELPTDPSELESMMSELTADAGQRRLTRPAAAGRCRSSSGARPPPSRPSHRRG